MCARRGVRRAGRTGETQSQPARRCSELGARRLGSTRAHTHTHTQTHTHTHTHTCVSRAKQSARLRRPSGVEDTSRSRLCCVGAHETQRMLTHTRQTRARARVCSVTVRKACAAAHQAARGSVYGVQHGDTARTTPTHITTQHSTQHTPQHDTAQHKHSTAQRATHAAALTSGNTVYEAMLPSSASLSRSLRELACSANVLGLAR
jgi:hypothetical protein